MRLSATPVTEVTENPGNDSASPIETLEVNMCRALLSKRPRIITRKNAGWLFGLEIYHPEYSNSCESRGNRGHSDKPQRRNREQQNQYASDCENNSRNVTADRQLMHSNAAMGKFVSHASSFHPAAYCMVYSAGLPVRRSIRFAIGG